MNVLARVIGFLIGGALIFFGFSFWMLSNDGIGDETSMKAIGAAGMILGSILSTSAVLWKRRRAKNEELDF